MVSHWELGYYLACSEWSCLVPPVWSRHSALTSWPCLIYFLALYCAESLVIWMVTVPLLMYRQTVTFTCNKPVSEWGKTPCGETHELLSSPFIAIVLGAYHCDHCFLPSYFNLRATWVLNGLVRKGWHFPTWLQLIFRKWYPSIHRLWILNVAI